MPCDAQTASPGVSCGCSALRACGVNAGGASSFMGLAVRSQIPEKFGCAVELSAAAAVSAMLELHSPRAKAIAAATAERLALNENDRGIRLTPASCCADPRPADSCL